MKFLYELLVFSCLLVYSGMVFVVINVVLLVVELVMGVGCGVWFDVDGWFVLVWL